MADNLISRKLAAVFYADVAGYSRLTGVDEEGTHRRVMAMLDYTTETIGSHGGNVLRYAGDAVLAEFTSVVAAVNAAAAIQSELATRNCDVPPDERAQIRIGVNIGDVIQDRGEIYGDGVNLAARLEAAAEPGGCCISSAVHDQIEGKIDIIFQDGGHVEMKNIAKPVRVYHWRPLSDQVPVTPQSATPLPGVGGVNAPDKNLAPGAELKRDLPNKPAIAVLPFDNMSSDPEQEFFADGLTEDIITELSRFPGLFVIARNSTFSYKGKPLRVQDVCRELGVHYAVEGSVRRAGNRVRVNVQLIAAEGENHIWAERYDRELTDIFDLQDEITQTIVATLPGRVESADVARLERKPPESMAAYDYVMRGKIHHHRVTAEDNIQALSMFRKAIDLEPGLAQAHAWLSCTIGQTMGKFGGDRDVLMPECRKEVEAAKSFDENDTDCNRILCEFGFMDRNWDDAAYYHDRAYRLNPNDPRVVAQRGDLMTRLGDGDEGVRWIETAMRLDPFCANNWVHILGRAHYMRERYEDAIAAFRRIANPRPAYLADMAACYARLGNDALVTQHCNAALAAEPALSVETYLSGYGLKEERDREHIGEGLKMAGLPA